MGCGESKHAVANTESLSTRKKQNSNCSKKVQSVKQPYETKATHIDENNSKIHSDTSNVVQKEETTINATRYERFVKQGKNAIMSINDIEMDLPSESKEEQKNKNALVAEDVTPNKDVGHNKKISLESKKEYDNEIKFDENLSAQHESVEKLSSCEEYKQDIIVEGDNGLDDKIKFDESLFSQNENNEKFGSNEGNQQEINNKRGDEINLAKSDENNVSSRSEYVDSVASGKEDKQDAPIIGDDYIDDKFSSDEEGKKIRLVQKDNNSKNEEEEKDEDGILKNLNEVVEDIQNKNASIDMETTPYGGQDSVMDVTVS